MPKQENPLINLFPQIERILEFVVVKNAREAEKYETDLMARDGALYLLALTKQDTYLSYSGLYTEQMFVDVNPTVKREFITHWIEQPYNIPLIYREYLRVKCREIVIKNYEERNDYYRMLYGLPPYEEKPENFVHVPEHIRAGIHASRVIDDLPIHLMDRVDQDVIVEDPIFKEIMKNNPDKEYLNFLGSKRIDPIISRQAKDFQLIRMIPMEKSSNLNPHLIKDFAALYNEYRDYIVFTLYNREFEDIFVNYRPFMALLLTLSVIMQLCNRAVEHSTDFRFLDDKIIATIFQMYGIPKNLILTMTVSVQRKLVTSIMKLIRKKATNPVFYDLVDILGFEDITISKLMLMRQQYFDDDGQAYFNDGTELNTWEDMDKLLKRDFTTDKLEKELSIMDPIKDLDEDWEYLKGFRLNPDNTISDVNDYDYRGLPYFHAVDLKSKNPYEDIVSDESSKFKYHEITDPDPRWWDLEDTRDLIRNKNYSIADSKYIMIESVIRESSYMYEVIYFFRMMLDLQKYTQQFYITIPELFGTTKVSIFDLMVFLLASMCYNSGLDGTILNSASGLLAVAGFNFEMDITKFKEFLDKTEYVDKERILEYLNNTTASTPAAMRFVFSEVIGPFQEWLTYMMSQCIPREEFLEYEKVFRSTYSYDIAQQVFTHDFLNPLTSIGSNYNILPKDMEAFILFYPHSVEGVAYTIDNIGTSGYEPFLGSSIALTKTWYVDTGRGNLYFYDILNSPDLRYVIDEVTHEKIPNPVFYDYVNNRYDTLAIEMAINKIKQIPSTQLANAFFRVDTMIPGKNEYYPGVRYNSSNEIISMTLLPESIRAEQTFKDILIDKINLDMSGRSIPPQTYFEYLERRNPMLANLFTKAKTSKTDWYNAIMIIVLAIESELNLYLKVFEQAVAGDEMYFKSLVTLIKYFKSYMIDFTKCNVKYIFDSKVDPGGGSNMLKLFDDIYQTMWHIWIDDEFGLYDTEHSTKHKWWIEDRSEMLMNTLQGTEVYKRETYMGSLRLVDEAKFFINGKEEDSIDNISFWLSGEENVGRFDMDNDRTEAIYKGTQNIQLHPVDREGWKEFVESYTPTE